MIVSFLRYLKNSIDTLTYLSIAVAGSNVAFAAPESNRLSRDDPAINPASVMELWAVPRSVMNHPAPVAFSEVCAIDLTTVKWSWPKNCVG